jgi:isoamylase
VLWSPPENYSREAGRREVDNTAAAMKSVVVDPQIYDWGDDAPLQRPASGTLIYEMHVRGFTRHPSSGLAENTRGTYAGLIEKIPYLQELDITAVELLPVFQFDAQDAPPGHVNYGGYAPVSFFAPHQGYSSNRDPLGPVNESRDMVKALHRAGSRGDSRRGLQSRRRRRSRRANAELPGPGEQHLLHS